MSFNSLLLVTTSKNTYKMLSLFLIISTLLVTLCSANVNKPGSKILVLNKNSFDAAIVDNEYVFIKFYASWCKHSRELVPHYIKAAKKVSELELPVKFAEIEASEENELCEKYNVIGYPYLILFRRGAPVDYYDDRTADDIVMWIESQVRPAVKELHTLQEAVNLINIENIVILAFYNNLLSPEAESFIKIADNFAKPTFAITSNEEIMNKYNTSSGTIMLLEKFGSDNVLFLDELTLANVKIFVEIELAPLIQELNSLNGEKIFGGKIKNHLLIFVSKKSKDLDNVLSVAKPVAKNYRKKITFLIINIDDEQLAQILTYFNVQPSDIPAIGLISGKSNMSKYRMKGPVTTDNIRKFLHDFEENKLSKILLSEQLPKNWDKTPVYTLVASNFVNVTTDSSKDVVVYFYLMDCQSCPIWDPIVKKLGEYYQSREDVIVSKINAGMNEFEKAPFKEIPSIVLYKKGCNTHVLYKGNPKYEDIMQFIESGSNFKVESEIKNMSKDNTEL